MKNERLISLTLAHKRCALVEFDHMAVNPLAVPMLL